MICSNESILLWQIKKIKEKLQEFLDEFKNINTPDEAITKFKEIFENEKEEFYEKAI